MAFYQRGLLLAVTRTQGLSDPRRRALTSSATREKKFALTQDDVEELLTTE
jgi:hypothetical protein